VTACSTGLQSTRQPSTHPVTQPVLRTFYCSPPPTPNKQNTHSNALTSPQPEVQLSASAGHEDHLSVGSHAPAAAASCTSPSMLTKQPLKIAPAERPAGCLWHVSGFILVTKLTLGQTHCTTFLRMSAQPEVQWSGPAGQEEHLNRLPCCSASSTDCISS
jgi:hypothetical protein